MRLSERQEQVLRTLVLAKEKYGNTPSQRELASALGIDTNNMTKYLRPLVKKGLVERRTTGAGERGKCHPTWAADFYLTVFQQRVVQPNEQVEFEFTKDLPIEAQLAQLIQAPTPPVFGQREAFGV